MSAVSGGRWRIQYGVFHFFNPACFSITARVPGSRSSEGWPRLERFLVWRGGHSAYGFREWRYHWTVRTFPNAGDAKEFLVSRIVAESQRESVSLSEVEKKMLYFSESAWTLPGIVGVSDAFVREYNQAEYEQKLAKLIRKICANDRIHNREEFDAWNEAVRILSEEDHYLLVLINAAESPSLSARRVVKLSAIALVVASVIIAIGFLIVNR